MLCAQGSATKPNFKLHYPYLESGKPVPSKAKGRNPCPEQPQGKESNFNILPLPLLKLPIQQKGQNNRT